MSQTPPVGPPGDSEEPDLSKLIEQLLGDTDNPALAGALRQMGLDKLDPATLSMVSSQLRALFESAPTDGINLELSTDVARKTVAAAGDAVVGDRDRRSVQESVHVAGLWLDAVTGFQMPAMTALAWSRAEWVTQTMDTWGDLVGPVSDGVNSAVTAAMRRQFNRLGEGEMPALPGFPPGADLGSVMAGLEPMMARMSSSMFGAQMGQAVGTLAGEILTGTEVGLPIVRDGAVVLLPANIAGFAQGLELDATQVQLYLAVREGARVRLFTAVPWLGPQLLAAVQAYARDISIDTDAIEAKLESLDPRDPEALQEALSGSLFSPTPSAAQQAALTRLETLLALVEGWVDVVSDRATETSLPAARALGEAVRRRRASGGPAEHLFGQLVGLQLRPRRLRDAANLFAALEDAAGSAARDEAWAHPDMAPTAADLDDPLGYVERATSGPTSSDLDAELARIFQNEDLRASREAEESMGPISAGPWPEYPYPPKRRGAPPRRPEDDPTGPSRDAPSSGSGSEPTEDAPSANPTAEETGSGPADDSAPGSRDAPGRDSGGGPDAGPSKPGSGTSE